LDSPSFVLKAIPQRAHALTHCPEQSAPAPIPRQPTEHPAAFPGPRFPILSAVRNAYIDRRHTPVGGTTSEVHSAKHKAAAAPEVVSRISQPRGITNNGGTRSVSSKAADVLPKLLVAFLRSR
jgi:hypothetical protein